MAKDEAERDAIDKRVEEIVKNEFKGLDIATEIKREYAALSEVSRAAIRAAARAVNHSELKDAECKYGMIADFAIEILRMTVRRQEPMPQVVMMPNAPQGPPVNPFGDIISLS